MIDEKKKSASPETADLRAGLESELSDLVQQKGWRSAKDVLTSYRNLEKMLGGDRLALPAKDADAEAWGPVWDKLGRPADAAGYALSVPAGAEYDGPTAQWFRDTAFEQGLTQTQAQKLHDAFLARFGSTSSRGSEPARPESAGPESAGPESAGSESSGSGTPQATFPEDEPDLRSLWGRQYDRNMAAARRAYGSFLGDEAQFNEIADGVGVTALLDLLAKVGRATGEDSITARADARGGGPRSPAEAMGEIARLQAAAKGDPKHPYTNKTHPEHAGMVKRMEDLFALAYGKN